MEANCNSDTTIITYFPPGKAERSKIPNPLNPNAKIQMSNECQITKCQSTFLLLFCHLDFGFHLNFELWHLTFSLRSHYGEVGLDILPTGSGHTLKGRP